jgi:hypothetical protein
MEVRPLLDELIVAKATGFIKRQAKAGKPFFTYVGLSFSTWAATLARVTTCSTTRWTSAGMQPSCSRSSTSTRRASASTRT